MNVTRCNLNPGSRIGTYTLERLLGTGGFGSVYAAQSLSGERVAVKVSHGLDARSSSGELAGQLNEIEAMMRLNHPSVVQVRDFGFTEDGRFYLAMELAEGEDLEAYLHRTGRSMWLRRSTLLER